MHALALPFIDTDRMTPTSPSGGKMSARVVIAVAYVVLFAAWMVWRWVF